MDMVTSLAVDLDLLHLLATVADHSLPPERMRAVIERELARFADAMEDHFAREEVARAALGDARLESEHVSLELRLLAVRSAALTDPLDIVRAALGEFLDALGEHERAEVVDLDGAALE